jgi:serine/threonine protein kinase
MTRCPSDRRLEQLLTGGLNARQTDALDAHVSVCPRCCERLDELTAARFLAPLRRPVAPVIGPATAPPAVVISPSPEQPVVPGYTLLRELGRGGVGAVYLATQQTLNRPVALKVLLASEFAGAVARKRFLAEAHAVARVRHPGVVEVYDFGTTPAGVPFLAMEYVPGGTLAALTRGKPVAPRAAARFVGELAAAVIAAHRVGIIHRDLKPSNVLLAPRPPAPPPIIGRPAPEPPSPLADWSPKVTDFGLVKWRSADNPATSLTSTGAVLGTPAYMSPEQASGRGDAVGPATDVYGLGAVLYELLTGRPPFRGGTLVETLVQVVTVEVTRPDAVLRGLPPDLVRVCLRCLAKDPAERYPDADALADDLHRAAAGLPVRGRRRRLALPRRWVWGAAAGLVVVALAAGGVSLVRRDGTRADPTPLAERPGVTPRWEPLPVRNPSFEESNGGDGDVDGLPQDTRGWELSFPPGTQGGFWNPPKECYRGADGMGTPAGGHGHSALWLFRDEGSPSPTAAQVTPTRVEAGRGYRLTVAVGRRLANEPFNTTPGGYHIELLAGDEVLAAAVDVDPLPVGGFADVRLEVSPDRVPRRAVGQPLAMRFVMTREVHRAATDFDHVRLEASRKAD